MAKLIINYNEASVKKMTWEQFSAVMQHHKTDTYLQGDWERITGKKVDGKTETKEVKE